MVPFAGLLAALYQIPDPRRRQGQRYSLAHLLLFAVLAILAGATSYRRIRLFIGAHRERLNATFGARFRRTPAVNTLRVLLHALDAAEIEAAFRRHAKHLGDAATSRAAGHRAGWQDAVGHAHYATTERYYNLAWTIDAADRHQAVLASLRAPARRRGVSVIAGSRQLRD